MKAGPVAAGVVVGMIAVAAVGTTLLGGLGGQPRIATPASSSPAKAASGSASASPSSGASTGMLTITPLPSSATPTRTSTSTSTTSKTSSTTSSSTTTTSSTSPYPDVHAPAGSKECDRSGSGPFAAVGTGNASTSCEFAVNVWNSYRDADVNGGSGQISAYSPATDKNYVVTCSGSQPAVCVAGVNGRVLIYGGRLISG